MSVGRRWIFPAFGSPAGITYTFSPGTTLAPGAFIVVCKDRAQFIAQFGAAVPLAPGVFTGVLDNAVKRSRCSHRRHGT
jgi:hypothetical protein